MEIAVLVTVREQVKDVTIKFLVYMLYIVYSLA